MAPLILSCRRFPLSLDSLVSGGPGISHKIKSPERERITRARPPKGLLIVSGAIRYLHLEAQLARSEEEFEDFSIALKLLGLLCDGWNSGPYLFNLACSYATGLPHAKYLRRRAERAEFKRLELLRAIPDYDYSREPRIPDRDPTDGRRHFGNKFGWHGVDTQAIKEAAARLGITEQTIYRRLRDGWTWEQTISEPQRQGRKLYGTQFCNLVGEASAGDDAIATREAHADDAGTDLRLGMWATPDGQNSVPGRPRAAGQACMAASDRRKLPKRISSAAQRISSVAQGHALAELHNQALRESSYFGA